MNSDPKKPIHLTELGKEQVQEAAEKLKDKKIEIIFTSEFPRAQETARIVNKYHKVKVKIDKRLNEIISGFEGKISKEWKNFLSSDTLNKKKQGAESINDVVNRIYNFLEDIKNRPEKEIVIATHGIPLRAIMSFFGEINIEKDPTKPPQNASIHKFELK